MYEQSISKTLTSHGNDLLGKLNGQRGQGLFCDITLKMDRGSFSAHKAVLAAVSEYFQEIFAEMDSTSNQESAIDLTGFSEESFLPLLEFSYTSTLSLKLENLTEISAMARHFRMWPVVEVCKAIEREQGLLGTRMNSGLPCQKESAGNHVLQAASVDASNTVCKNKTHRDGSLPSVENSFCDRETNHEDSVKNSYSWVGESSSNGSVVSKTQLLEDSFKMALTPSNERRAETPSKLPKYSTSMPNAGQTDEETFHCSPVRRLKLMDFKSPSNKRKSPRGLSSSTQSLSPSQQPTNMAQLGSPLQQKAEDTLTEEGGSLSTPSSSKYKQKLRFSHSADCGQEMLSACPMNLRTPIKQEPIEEEVQSPNTLEKYKLLSVLGLQRKSLVVCGEELTGWRQKKRLRKLKVSSYSLTARRKPRTVQNKPVGLLGVEGPSNTNPMSLGKLAVLPSLDCLTSTGKSNLSLKKTIKTEPITFSTEELRLDMGGCGLSGERNTRSKVASMQLMLSSERRSLRSGRELMSPRCDISKSSGLQFQNLPRLRPGNVDLRRGFKDVTKTKQGNLVKVPSRRLNLQQSHVESFLSLKVKKSIAKTCSLDEFSERVTRKTIRALRNNRQAEIDVYPQCAYPGKNFSVKQEVLEPENHMLLGDLARQGKETESSVLGGESQSFRAVVCKVEPFSELGKRKSKPTQKLLDAGFLFNLYRPGNAEVATGSTVKRGGGNRDVALKKSVSQHSTKEERFGRSQSTDIASRTRGAVREAQASRAFQRNLLKLAGSRPLVKRKQSCLTPADLRAQNYIHRSTLRKGRVLPEREARLALSDELPKKIRKLVRIKSRQPTLLEAIRRKRIQELKVGRPLGRRVSAVASHTCAECKVAYKNCDALIMHKIRHIKGKHWPCPLCSKSFFRQRNVQNHIRMHDQKLYKCRHCIT
ncbi:ZBT11 protein, partial [Amia calva]|nr:ZBT11 protein [Amia calva]